MDDDVVGYFDDFDTGVDRAWVGRIGKWKCEYSVRHRLDPTDHRQVGILRTTVAEMCPWKELQPLAFSVMPMVWTVGAVIGRLLMHVIHMAQC